MLSIMLLAALWWTPWAVLSAPAGTEPVSGAPAARSVPFECGQSARCIAAAGANVYKGKNTGYCYE